MVQCFSEGLCVSVSAPLNHMDLVEVHTAAELLRLRHMILGEVRQHLKIIFLSYLNGNFPVILHKPCQFLLYFKPIILKIELASLLLTHYSVVPLQRSVATYFE